MSNVGTDGDGGKPNTEQLVDETSNGNEGDTNDPSTEGARRNGAVIVIVDDGPDFSVR